MPDLNDYRAEIDVIDTEITRLFEKRMNVVKKVTEYKRAHNMPVLQASREAVVLEKAVARLENPEYADGVRTLFETLMGISRASQHEKLERSERGVSPIAYHSVPEIKDPRLGYPGVEGSFSEQALVDYFDHPAPEKVTAFDKFEDVAKAVASGQIDYGVLPFENSSAGPVSETYDLLIKHNLVIIGEQVVKVQQHLLGVPGATLDSIREVHSHPQGLAQCQEYLKQHDWTAVPSLNTAISAKMVADSGDTSLAAIASSRAAELYGLQILAPAINTDQTNHTRFVVVARAPIPNPQADKATVFLTLENKVGSLYETIGCFARHQINMSRIDSRPIMGKPWEYSFYLDFEWEVGRDIRQLTLALEEASHSTSYIKLLGLYTKANDWEATQQ